MQNITGGPQSDTFVVANQAGIAGLLDGGSVPPAGTNTLDYSAYKTSVSVNIVAGTATNMGSIIRIQGFTLPDLTTTSTTVFTDLTNIVSSYEFYKYTLDNKYNLYREFRGFIEKQIDKNTKEITPVFFDSFLGKEQK